jgi:hypothetical protein
VTAPLTTAQAAAAGWVECRTCGHRCPSPEDHNALGTIRCPSPQWMAPQPRFNELPKPDPVQTFRPPPRPPQKKKAEQ